MTAATSRRSSGADGLLLDHRRDDEDVVRREVLRARVPEIDLAPASPECLELIANEPRGRCELRELVRRGEEEALDRAPRPVLAELRRRRSAPRGQQVAGSRQPWRDSALLDRDLAHGCNPVGHVSAREPLREDDPQPRERRSRIDRRRRLVAHAACCERAPPQPATAQRPDRSLVVPRTPRGSSRGGALRRARPRRSRRLRARRSQS